MGWATASLVAWGLDVLTTVAVIAGGGYEANPLAEWMQSNYGMSGWAFALLIPALGRAWFASGGSRSLATLVCRIAVVMHFLVVAWNFSMIGLLLAGY